MDSALLVDHCQAPEERVLKIYSHVIDFDKDATWIVLLENVGAYIS
jgi:hypothetical protein